MRQEIVPEESYRTSNVEGAIVTSMGIIATEKGGWLGFIDFDDGEGMGTYNLTNHGEIAGLSSAKDSSKWDIPGYFDFARINRALKEYGYLPYIDTDINAWETEPAMIGKRVWINMVKTGTSADGTEYFKLLKIVKIEDGGQPTQQATPQATSQQQSATPAKSNDLKQQWTGILSEILTTPCNEIEINSAVRKAFPNDATLRKQLSDVRKQTLAALVSDGVLELTEDGKYQLAV